MTEQRYVIGDCMELMKEIPDNSIDLILTDPPYGQENLIHSGYGRSELGHRYIANDDSLDWLPVFAQQSFRVCVERGWCAVFGQWRTSHCFVDQIKLCGFDIKTVGIWLRGMPSLGAGLAEGYDVVIFARKGDGRENRFRSNVFDYQRYTGRQPHPHMKPVKLFNEIIELLTAPGGTVFDPFLGSGTTLRACRETGRNGIGFEINPEYEPIIKERIFAETPSLESYGDGPLD